MASFRHTLRGVVLQSLFAFEFRGGDIEELLHYNIVNGAPLIEDTSFALSLMEKLMENKDELKVTIEKFAPDWPFEKIAPIDRAILQIGLTELIYSEDVPSLVAINEAIELAKEYGTEKSPKFINGVLSSVYDQSFKNK